MTEEKPQSNSRLPQETSRTTAVNQVNIEGAVDGIQPVTLQQIAGLVHDINFYLESPVESIIINPNMGAGGSATGGLVQIARRYFDSPEANPQIITWHELSHKYFQELRGTNEYYSINGKWKPYAEELNPLYVEAVQVSLAHPSSIKVSPIANMAYWTEFKDNSVIALFNPANYRSGKHSNEHPHWHSGELFAYASEMMRFYPEQLKSRIALLTNKSEKKLALKILKKVSSAFVGTPNHPKSLDQMNQFT